ncbi:MAG: ATP synthase F1 subunit gamma [Bacteroidales bacterium]|nr:ATP synthase F1 subunit gamma [Bacteroidales bacterium]
MPTLKEIRTRINTVTTTRQTTSAMKMVSAAKLHKAQDRLLRLRPYKTAMQGIIARIAPRTADTTGYTAAREPRRVLIVVITSDKGLCGALNSNTVKHAFHIAETTYRAQWEQGQVTFMAFGEKGRALLQKRQVPMLEDLPVFNDHFDSHFTAPIAERLMQAFERGEADHIVFVYHRFKNAATQEVADERFLPMLPETWRTADDVAMSEDDYIYEPDRNTMLEYLLPGMLRLQCYCAFCEAAASEHGSRMTSMHQATDNADKLIEELSLQYNKARQAAITNQLVEIVSSTEAQR